MSMWIPLWTSNGYNGWLMVCNNICSGNHYNYCVSFVAVVFSSGMDRVVFCFCFLIKCLFKLTFYKSPVNSSMNSQDYISVPLCYSS